MNHDHRLHVGYEKAKDHYDSDNMQQKYSIEFSETQLSDILWIIFIFTQHAWTGIQPILIWARNLYEQLSNHEKPTKLIY